MEFSETVRRRRSIRRFDQRPVPGEIVDRVLDQARRSPTAGFAQGVDFVVLDTPESIADFWRITADPEFAAPAEFVEHGPTVIVLPIADHRRYLARYSEDDKAGFGMQTVEGWPVKFWEVDAAMAAMTALLAAVDQGLATWFFGINENERALLDHLGVPDGIRPIGIIGLGYRADDEEPMGSGTSHRRRPFDEQIHRNGW